MRNERRHAAAAHVLASENGPRADRAEDRLRARLQSRCFVCSQDNPAGLKVRFRQLGDGEAVAAWSPGQAFEGFSGIVHGGVLSAVLDEAMSKAVPGYGMDARYSPGGSQSIAARLGGLAASVGSTVRLPCQH